RSMSWTDNLVTFDRCAAGEDRSIVSADILDCVKFPVDIENRSNASVQINGLVISGLDAFSIRDKNPVGHDVRCVMKAGRKKVIIYASPAIKRLLLPWRDQCA